MRIKPSAQKARQRRDRNRRNRNGRLAVRRAFRCEPLESRVMLDGGGLAAGGVLEFLPPDPLPTLDPGTINGRVWVDADGSRDLDAAETGQGGVTVYSDFNFNGVLDANEPSTVTSFDDPVTDFDEGGLYTLDNLHPGWHNIRQVTPSGFEQTFPSLPDGHLPPPWGDASVHVTFVGEGQLVEGVDFGNQAIELGSISGVKWEDLDGDGVRGTNEPGLAGVTIYSDLNFNAQFDANEPHAVTSADDPATDFDETGQYSFDVEPGIHYVREIVPDGYHQTFPNVGFSDPLPGLPPTGDWPGILPPQDGAHFVLIASGQSVDGIDFGNQLIRPGSISGVKWEDVNGNGVRDANESGVAGVAIYADVNFDMHFDADEPYAVTMADDPSTDFDESGLYSFAVDAGLYAVREVLPEGSEQTYPSFDVPTPHQAPFGAPPRPGDEFAHFVFVGSGQSVDGIDFGNRMVVPGSISGVKWNDANGNGERDPNEAGLAGVTIYVDLNDNGLFDTNEPHAITTADIPETDFDEGGQYTLSGLTAGDYAIREVVPNGFRQTFPVAGGSVIIDPNGGIPNEFATVEPGRIDLDIGEVRVEQVSITIHPNVFVPIEIDVMASPADALVINTTGPQLNGGGGDTSTFEILILPTGTEYVGEIQFIDLAGGNVIASIPLTIGSESPHDGAHRVTLAPGEQLDGIDFGNQRIETTTGIVAGRKWEDLNGNGQHDPLEPGLAGVTIFADLNQNGVLDNSEPFTVTSEDNPLTDADETGRYRLEIETGEHWISEVVPDGFVQTFPNNAVIAIFPPPPGGGVHFVTVEPGRTIDDLDFGNRRVESGSVSGTKWSDLNGNGERDPNEPGLAGVTIYADYNFNGQLDIGEPSTVTQEHPPFIDSPFDLTGWYRLEVRAGFTAIREIVPDGHLQTYPISDAASPFEEGAHFVSVESGVNIPDLDFGNQPLDNFPSGVSGRKWEDFNANGQRDADEPGLGGVTIYVDVNRNGVLDDDEPIAVTMEDLPETDFDEGGLYSIDNLSTGVHVIREVVPTGFVQTFPVSIAASPLESGAHFVFLAPGEHVEGLDFGNLRFGIPLPGDFNSDGTVDHRDLETWEESYGSADSVAGRPGSDLMSGSDFLTWQQNFGLASVAPPADVLDADSELADSTEPLPTGLLRATYRPTSRASLAVIEAAFAEEPISGRIAAATLAPEATTTRAQPVRGAVAPRAAYAALAAAIDAALEDDFDD